MENKFEKYLKNSILSVIKNGFICISGLTIVASILTLLANFPIECIRNFLEKNFGKVFTTILPAMSNAFYCFISIYVLVSMSYQASKYYKYQK